MFGAIKVTLQLSAAAVVVQNLLERWQHTGLFDLDPKALSSKLVARAYGQDEGQFNGKKGPRPHKIAVAALAFAQGMRDYDLSSDEYNACHLSIGSILMEIEANGHNYPLTGKDRLFLELAAREYASRDPVNVNDVADLQPPSQDAASIAPLTVEARSSDPELRRRMSDLQARMDAFPGRN
ncbi:hypothetical protein [Sphingobium scionense]|uniref:Uncharacterized protein n=1 Tax=Sphingobium scionense TaxID=1404341 RepID=A0A7W6LWB7_9SPHN|nr:hypothetical protein [Sphingobium scionense]MBB4151614.1 hypothetical protein [Sphingobium scionense]